MVLKKKGKIIVMGITVLMLALLVIMVILALTSAVSVEPIGERQCPDSQMIKKKYAQTNVQDRKYAQGVLPKSDF